MRARSGCTGSLGYRQRVGTSRPAARAASRIVAPSRTETCRPSTVSAIILATMVVGTAPSWPRGRRTRKARGEKVLRKECDFIYSHQSNGRPSEKTVGFVETKVDAPKVGRARSDGFLALRWVCRRLPLSSLAARLPAPRSGAAGLSVRPPATGGRRSVQPSQGGCMAMKKKVAKKPAKKAKKVAKKKK
jgi:hypothetical protein